MTDVIQSLCAMLSNLARIDARVKKSRIPEVNEVLDEYSREDFPRTLCIYSVHGTCHNRLFSVPFIYGTKGDTTTAY